MDKGNLRIGSIVIDVKDFDRMKVFWQTALGYTVERPYEPGDQFPAGILEAPTGKGPNVTTDRMEPSESSTPRPLHR